MKKNTMVKITTKGMQQLTAQVLSPKAQEAIKGGVRAQIIEIG
ncbi:MAG: hypothetical protein AAGD05_00100 [Bacteroidota bacterium]